MMELDVIMVEPHHLGVRCTLKDKRQILVRRHPESSLPPIKAGMRICVRTTETEIPGHGPYIAYWLIGMEG